MLWLVELGVGLGCLEYLMKGCVTQTGGAYEIFTIISGRIELNL